MSLSLSLFLKLKQVAGEEQLYNFNFGVEIDFFLSDLKEG